MDHDIFHLGIVDGSLRGAAPGVEGACIIRIEADDMGRRKVEIEAARILDPAAEDEVELAHAGSDSAGAVGGKSVGHDTSRLSLIPNSCL